MSFLEGLLAAAVDIAKNILPTTAKVTIAGASVSVAQIETSTGTIASFLTAMQTAIRAKNYAAEAELTVEEVLTIATDLGIGEPYVGIAKLLFPILFSQVQAIAATPLMPVNGGLGGFVTRAWADDPRERLDPDGSFKN